MSRKTQKRKSIHTSSMFGELPDVLPDVQTCEWPECENQGEHRAGEREGSMSFSQQQSLTVNPSL